MGSVWCYAVVFLLNCVSVLGYKERGSEEFDHIKNVHVIFMNHLDVGYDGIPEVGFINNIINRYFHVYFPRAIKLANDLQDGGYRETFVYTTHPWLVSLYIDCPPNLVLAGVKLKCPNESAVADFVEAVNAGFITWHAGPMNMQTENIDSWLFSFGLKLGSDLDDHFGIHRKIRVMSQRDVPGVTQAILPNLMAAGVVGVSVGVNPFTPPPAVPKLFVWQHEASQVLAAWHAGGYPNDPGRSPSEPGGLSLNDCVVVPNVKDALCFAFRTDNSGPPESVQEILGYYEILRSQFPGARIAASKLETFFEAVLPYQSQLPVVTQEISDTWIQGIASDPRKEAEYRAVSRVMKNCFAQGVCDLRDARLYNASRFLLKLGEHTWGLPGVDDYINWSNVAFNKAKSGARFINCTLAWSEQRQFIDLALDALGNHPVVDMIYKELALLKPALPDLSGYDHHPEGWNVPFNCPGNISLSFGDTGAIAHFFVNGVECKEYAGLNNHLGMFVYYTYTQKDFDDLFKVYSYGGSSAGFYKNNMTENAHPQYHVWVYVMVDLYTSKDKKCDFYGRLIVGESEAHTDYGAPSEVWVHYTLASDGEVGVNYEVLMINKTSTRLPEAFYYMFHPLDMKVVLLSKLGNMIDPYNVVLNGSQFQHGVDDGGVAFDNGVKGVNMRVSSPDVPLVCPMLYPKPPPTVFPMPLAPISDTISAIAFNIYNNIWDTNYIFWYPFVDEDKDFKARFQFRV